jgi:hypothetical protein
MSTSTGGELQSLPVLGGWTGCSRAGESCSLRFNDRFKLFAIQVSN